MIKNFVVFSLTVKGATLIFISGRGLAISSYLLNKRNQALFIIFVKN